MPLFDYLLGGDRHLLLYHQWKQMSTGESPRNRAIQYYIGQVYAILGLFRIASALLPQNQTRLQYDRLGRFLYDHFYNHLLVLAFITMVLFLITLRHLRYRLQPNWIFTRAVYDITVRNLDIYRASLKSEEQMAALVAREAKKWKRAHLSRWSNKWLDRLIRLAVWMAIRRTNGHVRKRQLIQYDLVVYPNLAVELRCKLAQMFLAMEKAALVFLVFLDLTILVVLTYFYISMTSSATTSNLKLILALDLFLLSTTTRDIFLEVYYSTIVGALSQQLHRDHLGWLNRSLEQTLWLQKQKRKTVGGRFGPGQMRTLRRFICEHTRWAVRIDKVGAEYSNALLFLGILLNMPAHISLLARLVFMRPNGIELAFTWVFFVSQSALLIVALVQTAIFPETFHASAKYLPALQQELDYTRIAEKCKFMALYETLTTGKKHGIKLGPGGTVTKVVVAELVLIYAGNLQTAFEMIMKKSLI